MRPGAKISVMHDPHVIGSTCKENENKESNFVVDDDDEDHVRQTEKAAMLQSILDHYRQA